MVTREEKHSTRGRAHLLFEMLQGNVLHDGWRDEAVKEALDLCLACKGCKGDCPVNVDMATYKAEFLSHYYAGRLRPRSAYAMGLIYWWARLAALAPSVGQRADTRARRQPCRQDGGWCLAAAYDASIRGANIHALVAAAPRSHRNGWRATGAALG